VSKIAVVYLARLAGGFGAIEAFAKSYQEHPAGQAHDLVIVCKGFTKTGEFAAIDAIFAGIEHQIFAVDDGIGFDIHAYRVAARHFDNEYFCFLNTYTQIRSNDWLRKLFSNLCRPDVGLVGATGSFESLYNSYKIISRVSWAAASHAMLGRDVTRRFAWLVKLAPRRTLAAPRNLYRRFKSAVGDIISRRPAAVERYDRTWSDAISPGGELSAMRDFPHFPNPHIRTNVFMLRREDFLAIDFDEQDLNKIACAKLESGPDGLSLSIMRRGLRLVVVGADGVGYEMEQWPTCRGFRSGDQSNLLASDNRTQEYDEMSPGTKATHVTMTWGGYMPGAPANTTLLGVRFSNGRCLSEIGRVSDRKTGRQRLFSIAIPTHNRLALVLDAIKTVTHQGYQNWEIVVFDNASSEPVDVAIRALGDPRIRCTRSDEFLPVTESWNRALDMARGDYVTLIGDDDGLAPEFFDRLNQLADRFDNPDAIFSSLYQFMHPGVAPGNRAGYVADLKMASFFDDRDYPFLIDKETARRAVDSSLGMRRQFMFNMPAYTVARPFLDSLRRRGGKVLQSPFPDYYFANLVLERANKIVGEPRPLAFQGVSRASFGFTLFNNRTEEGFKALGHDPQTDELLSQVSRHLLPGPRYNSQYILTMAYVAKEINNPSRQPDFARYRKIQIFHWLKSQGSVFEWRSTEEGREMWSMLSRSEKIWALKFGILHKLSTRIWRGFEYRIERAVSQHAFQPAQIIYNTGDFVSGFEVFQALEQNSLIRKKQPVLAAA